MQLEDHRWKRRRASWTVLFAVVAAGCSQVPSPVAESAPAMSVKTPVVFVPGVTGVGLRDTGTDKLVWGKGGNLMRPQDRGYGTARSVTPRHPGPRILPDGVILDLRIFGVVRYRIYRSLVDLFLQRGYRLGDLEQPRPADEFFLFSYDWRQDNMASAARLADQLDTLRRARGQETLRVHLVCQSNGAHVCRYFNKFGRLTLEDAESGRPRVRTGVTVDKLILVGTSNGGSIRVLRELNRGRKYVDVVGRFWAPETLFTFMSLYQDLPVYTADLFVDESGQPLAVDLFDVESWKRYQWSIYGRAASRRLAREDLPPWLGTGSEREDYLFRALDRARRFHELLRRDVANFGATRYFLITNMGNDTPSRAVLARQQRGWQTRFADDKQVRRDPTLRSAVVVAGDGHATAASQKWLSPQEAERLGENLLEVAGSHRRAILQEPAQRQILQILAGEPPTGS